MKNKKLEQVRQTIAFLRSVILSGESMTEKAEKEVKKAFENIKDVDDSNQ